MHQYHSRTRQSLSVSRNETKRRSMSAHFHDSDRGQKCNVENRGKIKYLADKSVGPTFSEYNVCYAPLRGLRVWNHKYRNLLVPHWLPMADRAITSSSCEENTLTNVYDNNDQLRTTWRTTRGTSLANRKSIIRNEHSPTVVARRTNLFLRTF